MLDVAVLTLIARTSLLPGCEQPPFRALCYLSFYIGPTHVYSNRCIRIDDTKNSAEVSIETCQ